MNHTLLLSRRPRPGVDRTTSNKPQSLRRAWLPFDMTFVHESCVASSIYRTTSHKTHQYVRRDFIQPFISELYAPSVATSRPGADRTTSAKPHWLRRVWLDQIWHYLFICDSPDPGGQESYVKCHTWNITSEMPYETQISHSVNASCKYLTRFCPTCKCVPAEVVLSALSASVWGGFG